VLGKDRGAETIGGTCDPSREVNNPWFTPTEPAAVLANHFGKGKLLRPCKFERKSGGCAGRKKKQNSVSDIVELHNLQESSVRRDREDRQGSEAVEECTATTGGPTDDDGRT